MINNVFLSGRERVLIASAVILALTLGYTVATTISLYRLYWNSIAQNVLNEFHVTGSVVAIRTTGEDVFIVVEVRNTRVARTGRFAALINQETLTFAQNPRIVQDVVVGYEDARTIDPQTIIPGSVVHVEIVVAPDGSYHARRILVGDPFPRE